MRHFTAAALPVQWTRLQHWARLPGWFGFIGLIVCLALPLRAQHGGSHAGFSGHAAQGSHTGPGAPSSPGFSNAPRYSAGRPLGAPRGDFAPSFPMRGASPRIGELRGAPSTRPAYAPAAGAYRPPYRSQSRGQFRAESGTGSAAGQRTPRSPFHPRLPYYGSGLWSGLYGGGWLLPYGGWLGPDDYYDGAYWNPGEDDSAPSQPDSQPESQTDSQTMPGDWYGSQPPELPPSQPAPDGQYRVWPRPPYPSQPEPQSSQPPEADNGNDAVTVVFKDGRAPLRIHNYLLSQTALTVWDGRERRIPVDQIDLTATEALNRRAGVEFQLPGFAK